MTTAIGKLSKLSKPGDLLSHYKIKLLEQLIHFPTNQLGRKMKIDLSGGMPIGVNDIICRINYVGDTGQGFINGKLVIDNFYNGIPWEISLKDFLMKPDTEEMVFYFRPMYKSATFIQDLSSESTPNFGNNKSFLEIGEPEFFLEYKLKVLIE